MARPLLLSRRFLPLFLRQFLTAFNDNFIKNNLILLILLRPQQADSAALVSLAGAIFIVPFFLFSALGGELADKYDKALVIRWLSIIEFGGASLAAIGLFYENTSILFIALFYFGVTAALFGPAKYGVLPDQLTQEELPSGNAYVESATFLAILSGAIASGFAIQSSNRLAYAGALIIIWLCSVIAARFIPKTAAAAPTLKIDLNIFRSTYRLLKLLRANETLRRLTVITSMFWLFGAIAMTLMPTVVTQQLHGSENIVTLHLTIFAIAIALGSCAAVFLLKGRIVLLPTVAGALLIATAAADLGCVLYFQQRSLIIPQQLNISSYFSQQGAIHATIDFALFAFSGGLMIVPAFAAIQALSPLFERARMIAAVNVHNAAFMAIGGVIVAYLQNLGLSFAHLLWITALLAFCSAVWILKKLIENPFSDFLSIFFRAFYRLEVRGLENFQKAGRNPIIALN
ncbi:MAG: MFS transporter, partial [Methylocystis sp.]